MSILLESARLTLRQFTAADAENLVRLDSDPEVMRYLSDGAPTPRAVIENEILPRFMDYDVDAPAFGFWAAIERSTDDFLGWFSFRPAQETPKVVALGYRLRRAAWGKGYATEGVRTLIDLSFTELGIQRVVATTYEENLASRRVMEKAGMTLVRRFRITEEDLTNAYTYQATSVDIWDGDELVYALEKTEWTR